MEHSTGLILEGGGMRGAFTAGVLDYFHDVNHHFSYIVGASAGACNGSSYVSGQRGRNYQTIVEYGDHPEYISYKRAIKKKELFGMDFIFDTLPNQLVTFDYESFIKSNIKFEVGTTDINTGKAVYYNSFHSKDELLKIIRASSSLPFVSSSITVGERSLLDGGIADPIPIQQSISAGNNKHVVVLTRNAGYTKKRLKFRFMFRRIAKEYPALYQALVNRHIKYNKTIKLLEEMEQRGNALIIRPSKPLEVGRVERNREKLHQLYMQGYKEAERMEDKLLAL